VTLTSGLVVPSNALARIDHCDLLLIVAGFALEAQATPALGASLRRLAACAQICCGVDGGPWIMARAGLLDGHSATAHWEDIERFAATFTQVHTKNARYQISGKMMTSAGATPAIDMMLALIARSHSEALSNQVAASFILDHSPSPTAPQLRSPAPQRHNTTTAKAHAIMEHSLDEPLAIAVIAQKLGLGSRALQKQFRTQLGTTAQHHYVSLRLNEARRRVRGSTQPLFEIALATGFGSQSSFSRAYAQAFGMSASADRRALIGA
jgi:transcriptional regulator GlxA family with amidase domain